MIHSIYILCEMRLCGCGLDCTAKCTTNIIHIKVIFILDKKTGAKRPREATENSPVAIKIKTKTYDKTSATSTRPSSMSRYSTVEALISEHHWEAERVSLTGTGRFRNDYCKRRIQTEFC